MNFPLLPDKLPKLPRVPEADLSDLEYFPEAYNFYLNRQKPVGLSRAASKAAAAVLRPQIFFAEGAQEDLHRIYMNSRPHIYVTNHRSYWDTAVTMSALQQIAPYDFEDIHVLANSGSFRGRKPTQLLARSLAFLSGGLPMPRKYEYNDHVALEIVQEAAIEQTDVLWDRLEPLGITAEGKQDGKRPPQEIGEIRPATAKFALRAARNRAPAFITPVGIAYEPEDRIKKYKNPRHPVVSVQRSIPISAIDTVDDITDLTQHYLSQAVRDAVTFYSAPAVPGIPKTYDPTVPPEFSKLISERVL